MPNRALLNGSSSVSSVLSRMSPSVITGPRSFFTQFMMTITVSVLLIGILSGVSCSPASLSNPIENTNNNNNKNTDESNGLFDQNDYQHGSQQDSSSISLSHHEQPFAGSSPIWPAQPRAHANQFLMSHANNNDAMVPKWFTQLNNNDNDDDDDDDDDYAPSGISVNKRLSYYNVGRYPILNKRKQVTKPPMEVMNEIVNSIYLKR
ncbi:unnamed protein product [Rotaria socialis]|uniref:Uncharacterized protein n=1 Tax=Rotaria socialis TaxID=392032 RepID=A0A820XHB9_9BILA|nr:unnamed protein product [Rotaria socialis]CAF3307645.1 unnamed protein product [Rotaria socialis]CAF3371946.1 unnamed protein product [Rotaria socialis]CAF3393286.1 unnamed protein product [Rotaria socialis]CAF4361867.1 unnamed protein product [Rotaria socialis]